MIYSINKLLLQYIYYYPVKVSIVVLIICIWFIIYKLFKYKVSIDYKIYHSWINWLAVSAYFSLYVIYILILRYLAWGKSISLKVLYTLIETQLLTYGILYISLLLSAIILCLMILIRLRTLLTKELIKRHIWLLYYKRKTDTKYKAFLLQYRMYYSYSVFNITVVLYIYRTLLRIIENVFATKIKAILVNTLENVFYPKLKHNLKYLPIIILLVLVIYDCYFNAWVITKIFYYLPFYMLFNLWYKSSQFLRHNNIQFDRIIYERYYCLDAIIYSNTTDEEEEILEDYIRKGFCYIYTEWDMLHDIHPIIRLRRFVRLDKLNAEGNIRFENVYQGTEFIMTKEELQKYIDS